MLYFSLPVVILLTAASVNSPIKMILKKLNDRQVTKISQWHHTSHNKNLHFGCIFIMNILFAIHGFSFIIVCYTIPFAHSFNIQPSVQNICELQRKRKGF